MYNQISNEKEKYINDILSDSINEIKEISNFGISQISNLKTPSFSNSLRELGLKDNSNIAIKKNHNNFLNLIKNNDIQENKKTKYIYEKFPQKMQKSKDALKLSLMNDEKNIDILDDKMFGNRTYDNIENFNIINDNTSSIYKQNLINKYKNTNKDNINIYFPYNKYKQLQNNYINKNNQNNNDLITKNNNINSFFISCDSQLNKYKKYIIKDSNNDKKFYPKSSALKNIINKIKRTEYDYSDDEKLNKNYINRLQNINNSSGFLDLNDSELFTLGNSEKLNINSSIISKQKQINKPKLKIKNEIFDFRKYSQNIIDIITKTNKYFEYKIKNKKKLIKSSSVKEIKKNSFNEFSNCLKTSIDSENSSKLNLYKIHEIKEKLDFKEKYQKLREMYEAQKEKMIDKKNEILILQKNIRIIDNKISNFPELYEYNQILEKQNEILMEYLDKSENILENQLDIIKELYNKIKICENI